MRLLRTTYVGKAWYHKRIAIPDEWSGRQVWLKIGGVNSEGCFWVNGKPVGTIRAYCGTYKFNITDLVKSGEDAVIVCEVRNDVTSRKGVANWMHRFGGLYRSVEIEATSDPSVDYAYVEPFFDEKMARVHVVLRKVGRGGEEDGVRIAVEVSTIAGRKAGFADKTVVLDDIGTADTFLDVKLDPFVAWSPEDPRLYKAEITLERDGKVIDGWVERFGIRKWETRDGHLFLNNQRYFLRGFGDDYVYPLTLCSPASREEHIKHLRIAKSFGFNYVRHHTHCELPEFFEAASEVGIMVQPELPYYGPNHGSRADPTPKEDLQELITHYRRYISLSTYCMGNEGYMGSPLDEELYKLAKDTDPTRLVIHQDGGKNTAANSDFAEIGGVIHEYLNLATYEDPRLEGKYTGVMMPPRPLAEFRKQIAAKGITADLAFACLDAGQELQKVQQKLGLENARKNPRLDGYIYWTILDVGSPSAQGLLDQFWGVKKSTAEYFREFNGPTAIIAKLPGDTPIFTSGKDCGITWYVSHFGWEPIKGKKIVWSMLDGGKTLVSGESEGISVEPGTAGDVARSVFKAPQTGTPLKAILRASIEGTEISNSWDIWIFPEFVPSKDAGKGIAASPRVFEKISGRYPALKQFDDPVKASEQLLVTDRLSEETLQALGAGKDVLLIGLGSLTPKKPGVSLGWWGIGPQAGTAVIDHPAWGVFPRQGYMNRLFFGIVSEAVQLNGDFDHVDKLMVGDGSWGYLIHVFQARAGKGRLFGCGLDLLSERPEAMYLLDQFMRYAASKDFKPEGDLDLDRIRSKLEALKGLNGWSATIGSSENADYQSFAGRMKMRIARQTDGKQAVVWRTEPVVEKAAVDGTYSFKWIAGTGWLSQKPGGFTLFLDDKALIDFEVTGKSMRWKSEDGNVVLDYTVMSSDSEDSSGIMKLTVPYSILTPGKPSELRVVGSDSKSARWFGLYESK